LNLLAWIGWDFQVAKVAIEIYSRNTLAAAFFGRVKLGDSWVVSQIELLSNTRKGFPLAFRLPEIGTQMHALL